MKLKQTMVSLAVLSRPTCIYLQLNGNIERCYEELKDRKWDLNRQPEELSSLLLEDSMNRNVGHATSDRNIDHTTLHTDTTYVNTPSHHLRRTVTYPDSSSPPEDNQDLLQRTWPRSLQWRTQPIMNYGGASPMYSFMPSPLSPSLHPLGSMVGSPPGLSSIPHISTAATGVARNHPTSQEPNTGRILYLISAHFVCPLNLYFSLEPKLRLIIIEVGGALPYC